MNSKIFVLLKLLLNGKYTISEIASEFGTSERLIRYIIDDCDFYLHSLNLIKARFLLKEEMDGCFFLIVCHQIHIGNIVFC